MSSERVYDAFLGFRGEDTRRTFVSHLHAALTNAGIDTFIDYRLPRGTEVGPELMQAIQGSRIAIVVFSKSYVTSSWCLNELEQIMKCRKNNGLVFVPIFYDVDPSDIRRQKGAFGKALQETAKKISPRWERRKYVLSNWTSALTEAGNASGWITNNFWSEAELLPKIVEDILRKLKSRSLSITEFPVGLDTHVQQVIKFINNQSSKVCLIGISGMGGSGKTTTARDVYNRIRCHYVDHSFIENIREVFQKGDREIIHLQELLSNVSENNEKIQSIAYGITKIEKRFKGKRALIVLDDVSTVDQVNALCGKCKCFGSGSVLIFTSRDVRILNLLEVNYIYSIKEMDKIKSLELFSWHAFRQSNPIKDFHELSSQIVTYCRGLPLALEVIGSSLRYRTKQEWRSTLSELARIPNDRVLEKLKISYNGLEGISQKNLFLDICCFFVGKNRVDVTEILNECGLHADIGISILIERNLVKVEKKNNKLRMHDLLRDMGRAVVGESSAKDCVKRLWFHEDVHNVLSNNMGTETVKGLVLKLQSDNKVCFNADSFKKMKNLRLLQLDNVGLDGNYGDLSQELRWLHWKRFTGDYIPDDFYQGNLVLFELKRNNIKQVWNETKLMEKLKILNLSRSKYFETTPNFSNLPKLEKLIMKYCPMLSELHPSIGDLRNLLIINFKDCKSLGNLPIEIYKLTSLKTLIISGCSKIDKLEEDIEQMKSLTTLNAKDTAITKVPYSIVRSESIGYIFLCRCEGFWMPPTINYIPPSFPHGGISLSLVSLNAENDNLGHLSPVLSSLSNCESVWIQYHSKIQLTRELERFLDDLNDANFNELETSRAFQISHRSLRLLSIGMGSYVLGDKMIQGLTTNGSSGFCLPDSSLPYWLAYRGEGPSVQFQVPEDIDWYMKGIILCVVYSPISENMAAECHTNVLIINHTKGTILRYKPPQSQSRPGSQRKQDTIMSFNDKDWKSVTSNLGRGDDVEIFVTFGYGLTIKETALYLINDQWITLEIEPLGANEFKVPVIEAEDEQEQEIPPLEASAPTYLIFCSGIVALFYFFCTKN